MPGGFDVSSFRQAVTGQGAGGAASDVVFSEGTSWLGSMGESLKGLIFGFLLVPLASLFLFLCEGDTIRTADALGQGRAIVKEASPSPIDPALEAHLVHVVGPIWTGAPIVDGRLGITIAGLQLTREVKMYQWQEDRRSTTVDGAKRVEYRYAKVWDGAAIDSTRFRKEAAGDRANPPMTLGGERFPAPDARLGAYAIAPAVLAELPDGSDLPLTADMATSIGGALHRPARLVDGVVFVGEDPGKPAIGDLKVSYKLAAPTLATAVAGQFGETLAPHETQNGATIAILRGGSHTADAMFSVAEADNSAKRWMFRGAFSALIFVGFLLILRPFALLVSEIPLLGWIVSGGTTLAAAAMTIVVAPLVVALAWLWYAPVFSVLVIGAAVSALTGFKVMLARRAASGSGHTAAVVPGVRSAR